MSSQDSRQQQSLWLSVTSSGDHGINAQADRTPFPPIEVPFMLARYLNTPTRYDPFSAYVIHEESLVRAFVVRVILNQLPRFVRFRRNMEDDLVGLGAQFPSS
ncbi:hypothetical protein BHE90_014794 [Fusarium euwallaceae]|uniref:Uncharacterized protein n=3 Tax=Fusarium solani species complex TaxID=232080 RepID=A0A3M2S3Y4_9HYPO|nr:hypothetical protein CDV36_008070 [Fusarium kuroshium]RSL48829.1 hypothetical protein CEP51_015584 [Fusarium floridanum]RTE70807.1 hypothetical protein BHE90_014794 [Fusarium euwallaceae]